MSDYQSKKPKYSREDVLKAKDKLKETVPNLAKQFEGRMDSGLSETFSWSKEAQDLQTKFKKLLTEYKALKQLFDQLENSDAFKLRIEACELFIAEEEKISNKSNKRKEFELAVDKQIKEVQKLSQEITREIKRKLEEKEKRELRENRCKQIAKTYPLHLNSLKEMKDWVKDVENKIPKEKLKMLTELRDRLNIHQRQLERSVLSEEISISNMEDFKGVSESIDSTIKGAYAKTKETVDQYLEEQRQDLENTQKEYEKLLSLLGKQKYSVVDLYDVIDDYTDMLEEIGSNLSKLLREKDEVLEAYFGKKVDDWIKFNNTLNKDIIKKLSDLANEAFLAKGAIEKTCGDVEGKLINNQDSKEDLLKDILILDQATKTNITKLDEIEKIDKEVKVIEKEVDPVIKDYYYKLEVGEGRLGKESKKLVLVDSSSAEKAEFRGNTYMLIPKSANVYGRITTKISNKVDAFFEDAMLRGLIAGFGKGQSGVKMRDASTYEIKVRRTVLTANQVSGTLRIDNTNPPVANEKGDKFFVTFNHQFDAH